MDNQIAAREEMGDPGVVVGEGRLEGVAAVDKDQAERRSPEAGDNRGTGDNRHDRILETKLPYRLPERGEGVDPPRRRVQELGSEIFLTRLLLFRPLVMID